MMLSMINKYLLYKKRENVYSWESKGTYEETMKKKWDTGLHITKYVSQVDLRKHCPKVYDQGKLGSCTANAIGFLYHFDELKQNTDSIFIPSRLFIYYNEREMEGTVKKDSGAEIHDGIQSVCTQGVCSEHLWPYLIQRFNVKPLETCYKYAHDHKGLRYHAIQHDINHFKLALMHGYPVAFGFKVFESFENHYVAMTGLMSMPTKDEKCLGGHAVALVGFDDTKKMFIARNSWGEEWGDKGYFYMPYEFIKNKNYTSDFWIIEKIR